MFSETPAPPPDVTADKIRKAAANGLRPVLILEELDKSKYSEPRVNFLFSLIDAIDGAEGQRIITSNRTLERFAAMFEESDIETVQVTAEPLMRRLLKDCNVRDYFNHTKESI
jgi:DNA replication protein DnaC